jgi:hypothetical protein
MTVAPRAEAAPPNAADVTLPPQLTRHQSGLEKLLVRLPHGLPEILLLAVARFRCVRQVY